MNIPENLARPDFVIIGAMKSATTSLQEQLEQQAGIFMTTPKEPNFFSNDEIYSNGLNWYSGLFDPASDLSIKGEASTHYTKLPKYPHTIDRLKAFAPDAKLIYVMRHPIDRLVSHYVHNWSMGFVGKKVGIEEALETYEPFVAYGKYAMQLKPWFDEYGRENICPVFFDRLLAEPQLELERICAFLGYEGSAQWRENLDPSNVSNQRLRKFPLYSLLVESPVAEWLRHKLVPQQFRDAIKDKLKLGQRPKLSEDTLTKLEVEFDEDLHELGKWMGVGLSCGNFKEVTSSQSLDWSPR